ncbi:MAG: GNAT family N-acetyltransferase [Flavobacteriales bacterium]|nr:GNAT family N-acetyltransferase [Flavobacteriales bacterium]
MEFTYITTDRLKLRLVNQEVLDGIFKNYAEKEIIEFFGESAAEKEIQRYKEGASMFNRTFLYFHLLDKNTDELIGWCGYHTWYLEHKRAEIGYTIYDDNHREKGYMSEALTAVIEYGFHEMYLHRIEALVGPYNRASLRLMKKFGFNEEGRLKEHYYTGGIYEDSIVFGLIKPQH